MMKEFELKLNEKDIAELNEALIVRPYGEVAELINKINQQLTEQQKATPHTEC